MSDIPEPVLRRELAALVDRCIAKWKPTPAVASSMLAESYRLPLWKCRLLHARLTELWNSTSDEDAQAAR